MKCTNPICLMLAKGVNQTAVKRRNAPIRMCHSIVLILLISFKSIGDWLLSRNYHKSKKPQIIFSGISGYGTECFAEQIQPNFLTFLLCGRNAIKERNHLFNFIILLNTQRSHQILLLQVVLLDVLVEEGGQNFY